MENNELEPLLTSSVKEPVVEVPKDVAVEVPKDVAVEVPKDVAVDPGVLKGILDRLDAKDDEIEILRNSISRYKLEQAEAINKPKGLPSATLMVHDGKVVTSFVLVKNKYVYNPMAPNTVAGEDLKMEITYLDGSKSQEIPYKDFFSTSGRVIVEKVGEDGSKWIVNLTQPDGKMVTNLKVDNEYLNP